MNLSRVFESVLKESLYGDLRGMKKVNIDTGEEENFYDEDDDFDDDNNDFDDDNSIDDSFYGEETSGNDDWDFHLKTIKEMHKKRKSIDEIRNYIETNMEGENKEAFLYNFKRWINVGY